MYSKYSDPSDLSNLGVEIIEKFFKLVICVHTVHPMGSREKKKSSTNGRGADFKNNQATKQLNKFI